MNSSTLIIEILALQSAVVVSQSSSSARNYPA